MKVLGGIGERLLARLVPTARAHAVVCFTEQVCKYSANSSCPRGGVRLVRKVCTNGSKGPWVDGGCC
ncbi:hypothetical protein [Phytomonospora endophytica]|uniref:Uncharacterized protein n=1 Tax=Phytomonospora endophytica TaxID=714109 RepID=A0A841FMR1_9ACTN|nr:hypothetical protein [Phytomonospora endophytica]MBB6035088.1 hypothetical protein [Phytomonospora endophytica]GIG64163.1 hypothetical protein Pen01_04580 [Phytomonospora endophytica]